MPQQDYDYVDFMQYDGETDKMAQVCRVYFTDGKLFYEGTHADEVKKLVDSTEMLAPFRKIGGYALFARLPYAFTGGYFYCTKIKEPFDAEEAA